MKKISIIAARMAVSSGPLASAEDIRGEFVAMMDRSFKTNGIAEKHRMYQLDFQKECSAEKDPPKKVMQAIEAAQLKTIRYPADALVLDTGHELEIGGATYRVRDVRAVGDGSECRATLSRLT